MRMNRQQYVIAVRKSRYIDCLIITNIAIFVPLSIRVLIESGDSGVYIEGKSWINCDYIKCIVTVS